jgi:hypothetical protein
LTYIDRPIPEYEPLRVLTIFRDPHELITKRTFYRRNPFGKILVFGKLFLTAEI